MSIKSLASQTMWYGLSNILGRFLNYLLSPLLFYLYKPAEVSDVMLVYVIVPFLNIIFTLGLETSYFRFSQQENKRELFNTLNNFLVVSTVLLCGLFLWQRSFFSAQFDLGSNAQYYMWMIAIVGVDTLCTIPFAKLRHEGKPKLFALIKLVNIVVNVSCALLFLVLLPQLAKGGTALPTWLYNPSIGIGYFIIANLIASVVTFILLLPQWKDYAPQINTGLLKKIMLYSAPIVIVGFGGMINDFLSRAVYFKVLSDPLPVLKEEFGIFIANYKLAVLVTLFMQVFKMGAEPFFFKQSGTAQAQDNYARVTKIFAIICCVLFLAVVCNLDLLKLIIAKGHAEYAKGLHIVPVLTLANIFLGIYYNLSVWYKVTNNTMKGAWITLAGVALTIALNIAFVPAFHYTGAAWATFCCYLFMLIVSYLWGQRVYPVPYDVQRITIYFLLAIALYAVYEYGLRGMLGNSIIAGILYSSIAVALLLFAVLRIDKEECRRLPLIGKWVK